MSDVRCPQCRGFVKKSGFTAAQKQRYQCLSCGKTWIRREDRCGKHRLPAASSSIARKLLCGGLAIRFVARILHISKTTVRAIARELGARTCPCGRDARHQGWCRFRYRQSDARQQFMQSWRNR